MARRPYDLRHAAASLWLTNGVPATEVARRLGHDVAMLLKSFGNCIDGQEDTINDQITVLARPVKTMRHCPRRQPCSTRPSQTRRPDGDQSQNGRLRTRQSRRSALVEGLDAVSEARKVARQLAALRCFQWLLSVMACGVTQRDDM